MGFAEEASIVEARLERDYQQLKPFNELIHSWGKPSNGHAPSDSSSPAINEELKRASRKVGGFWSRSASLQPSSNCCLAFHMSCSRVHTSCNMLDMSF
jgi:hypothetical protein